METWGVNGGVYRPPPEATILMSISPEPTLSEFTAMGEGFDSCCWCAFRRRYGPLINYLVSDEGAVGAVLGTVGAENVQTYRYSSLAIL